MSRVYKYTINLEEKPTVLKLPRHTVPLSVGVQGREIRLWARVNELFMEDLEERTFGVAATGYTEVPDDANFIGTVQIEWTVWHVFEVFS